MNLAAPRRPQRASRAALRSCSRASQSRTASSTAARRSRRPRCEERGVRKGDRVALRLPNTPAYVAAYFGILRLGAIAVPLNVLLAQPEVETRLEAASTDGVRRLARYRSRAIATRRSSSATTTIRLRSSSRRGRPAGRRGPSSRTAGSALRPRFGAEALSFTDSDVVLGVAPVPARPRASRCSSRRSSSERRCA